MIHCRPGFAPRTSDDKPAQLNDDMIPAINRKSPEDQTPAKTGSTLEMQLNARTEAAAKRLEAANLAHAQAIAAAIQAKVGPEVIRNINPSTPPRINEPGK
jgi:hypothetical protein